MDEDAAMFSARFQDFERKNKTDDRTALKRPAATKKVSEGYHLRRAKREKEEEMKRIERELREEQTQDLVD